MLLSRDVGRRFRQMRESINQARMYYERLHLYIQHSKHKGCSNYNKRKKKTHTQRGVGDRFVIAHCTKINLQLIHSAT